MGLLDRELGQEVLINAAEHVAGGLLDLLAVEHTHEFFEHLRLEDAVVLGQHALERLELLLDGFHRVGHELRERLFAARRLRHDPVVPCGLGQWQRPTANVVLVDDRPFRHLAGGLVLGNLPGRIVESIGSVPEEDDPQHGHEVVAGGELGVGA